MTDKPYTLIKIHDDHYQIKTETGRVLFTLHTQEEFEPFERRRFLYSGHGNAEDLIGQVDAADGETLEDSVRTILRNEAAFLLGCANAIVSQ